MLFQFKKNKENEKSSAYTEEIQNILSFSESIIESYVEKKKAIPEYSPIKHPIFEVINILGRKIQSDYMLRLISVQDESDLQSLMDVFLPNGVILTKDGKTFSNFVRTIDTKAVANLNVDPVLPWPWKRQRLRDTITNIGKGRRGVWKEDKRNHSLSLVLPMGIFVVNSGNHSISVGVLQGTGTISAEEVEDISEVYDHVYCDGRHYIRKCDKELISEVTNFELAALFEIGRLMKKHSISFL
ncbi:filamentous bacteriophage production protein Fip [Oceanobacillus picturae]|uniref:Filamentous bacteriophage production protein Fip n=1 Tax=Oceanobacillus picturae TaxID=171693 RepID=A0A0U9HDD9_9BACI|nr:DUF6710 family protein [Oceanobacillus picturae]GAQ19281.1 filamentous bacteriophage production protein Fip [Oceanobacillus picturae]